MSTQSALYNLHLSAFYLSFMLQQMHQRNLWLVSYLWIFSMHTGTARGRATATPSKQFAGKLHNNKINVLTGLDRGGKSTNILYLRRRSDTTVQ